MFGNFRVNDFAIGNTNRVTVFEMSYVGVAENDVSASAVPSGKTVAPSVGAAEVRGGCAVVRSFTLMYPLFCEGYKRRRMNCLSDLKRGLWHV